MDDWLQDASAVVLADIRATKTLEPDIVDRDLDKFEGYESAWLQWPSGSGQGFGVDPTWPLAERVATLADTFQEAIIEELSAAHRPATWPEHPNSHPLTPSVVVNGRPTWICPRTERTISEIGGLAGERT